MKLHRKISLFVIISSAIAIICNLFLIPIELDSERPSVILLLIDTFSPFHLHINAPTFDYKLGQWVNLFFDILFLYGGVLYLSKGKKMHILRFLFSVILISKIITFLNSFVYLKIGATNENLIGPLLLFLYHRAIDLVWVYLSFRLLKYMNGTRTLEITSYEHNAVISTSYIAPSKTTRIFHLMIDMIMMVFIFANPIASLLINLVMTRESKPFIDFLTSLGSITLSIIIFPFVRLTYYLFFEAIFQASPAKFLTETRVLTADGNPMNLTTSLVRTLARWIPFNALSFLFARSGWHDRVSGTCVLKEKKNSGQEDHIS